MNRKLKIMKTRHIIILITSVLFCAVALTNVFATALRSFWFLVAAVFLLSADVFAVEYVGSERCSECHAPEAQAWRGSHHDLAMAEANDDTVLGDFDNAQLISHGVNSRFYKQDGKFFVRTDGPDGELHDYPIRYTFGWYPLQQYLIEFPRGHMQSLGLAWDSRPADEGGQRWFHLYPGEAMDHTHPLHWTGREQTWNYQCAECHSTDLKKNYDPATDSYSTTWLEINVACEACHGPGAAHLNWAERAAMGESGTADSRKGLTIDLCNRGHWRIDEKTGKPHRGEPRTRHTEIELCARCHSRRGTIWDDYEHGKPLLDTHRVAVLEDTLYFPDGQIKDEVYVYGSFLQSKMYQAGVTCSDCHDPHTLNLKAPGNGVCLQCHEAAKYDRSDHHFHKPDEAGGSCAECHMPARTYMVVDPRHDHSMRIPRPDLSLQLGTPNACNACHTDKDPKWAAEQFRNWYPARAGRPHPYAEALAAGRNGGLGAEQKLAALVRDVNAPDIARASALAAMSSYISRASFDTLQLGLDDANPMLRVAALEVVQRLPAAMRVPLAFPLLDDPVRAVRIQAAVDLAGIPPGELSDPRHKLLEQATAEYVRAQQVNAERPEAQTNLGNLYAAQKQTTKAVGAYNTAIGLGPSYIPAYVNLADLYRSLGDEKAAEQQLRQGLKVSPENADAHHALGMSLVRQKRTDEAIEELRLASVKAPHSARYIYVYAVALNSTGQPEQAVQVLQNAHERFPNDTDILSALVAFHRDMGNQGAARGYAEKLRAITP
jgi:predicted CXXCH cytochrome family protein